MFSLSPFAEAFSVIAWLNKALIDSEEGHGVQNSLNSYMFKVVFL